MEGKEILVKRRKEMIIITGCLKERKEGKEKR
jgi:hypothetical protein